MFNDSSNLDGGFTRILAAAVVASLLLLVWVCSARQNVPGNVELGFRSHSCNGSECDMSFFVRNSGASERSFKYVITAVATEADTVDYVLGSGNLVLDSRGMADVNVSVDVSDYGLMPAYAGSRSYEIHFYLDDGQAKVGVTLVED